MPQRLSGKRYAQAIFELAVQQDQAEQWAEALQFAAQVLQDDEFRAFLRHAEVSVERKVQALEEVLGDVPNLVKNLTALLVTRGAVAAIGDVHAGYVELLDQHLGRQQIQVTSAVALEDQEVERIRQFVADLIRKEVVIVQQVDESILGGVIIQIGDKLLDGSTRSKLEELRRQIRTGAAA
jgi:F-type H+-transporting ATPase subunit delta